MFLQHQIDQAIKRLREFEPEEGYYLAFSGGKDSIVIKQLAIESGVKFDAHYSVTTIDPPDLIYFIRKHHAGVTWDRPKQSFLRRLISNGFPMRTRRWCCEEYKENSGDNRVLVLGIRWAESARRNQRKLVEHCMRHKSRIFVNPIIDWSDNDVWEFIHDRKLPYCNLYDEGWRRIGCLFCPMSSVKDKVRAAERYPGYYKSFRRAFNRLWDDKKDRKAYQRWVSGDDMFDWWFNYLGGKVEETDNDILQLDFNQ